MFSSHLNSVANSQDVRAWIAEGSRLARAKTAAQTCQRRDHAFDAIQILVHAEALLDEGNKDAAWQLLCISSGILHCLGVSEKEMPWAWHGLGKSKEEILSLEARIAMVAVPKRA